MAPFLPPFRGPSPSELLADHQDPRELYEPRDPDNPEDPDSDQEDCDVAAERRRVTGGAASGDVLKLRRLTKVYRGAGTAVDRLCFGVARGEVSRVNRFGRSVEIELQNKTLRHWI